MSKAFILRKRPVGKPEVSDFELVEYPIPELESGQLLLSSMFYSVDPYMRGRMSDHKSYIAPFELESPIVGGVVAKVIESRDPNFNKEDVVIGMLKWQDIQVAWANDVKKIDVREVPPSIYLGLLGLTGLTAYFGLIRIGMPKPAETLVISGAAGAVGTVVGQIGKILGCNVIGIAGSKNKIKHLKNDFNFDEALDYHDLKNMDQGILKAAPLGVDVYFDNVGGVVSEHVMQFLNHGARVVICGQISLYNDPEKMIGVYPQIQLLKNSARMQGFIVSDFQTEFHDGMLELLKWYKEGLIISHETIVKGFEKLPETFISLFDGKNIGKMIVEA